MNTGARDKSAKFVELANKRVNTAIKDLRLVANLANRRNYEFDEEQAKKIVRALQRELDEIKSAFSGSAESAGEAFKL